MFAQRLLHQFAADDRRARQRDVLSDHVVQLTNIAGPFGRDQHLDSLGRVDLAFLIGLPGNLLQEMRDQQRDVFAPIVERRQLDVDDVQSVVKIFAEATFAHELLQIAVRRRDDAHVDLHCFGAADRAHLVLLQHAQQFDLQPHRHVADFVQHQGAALGRLEQAAVAASCAGESAFLVAEQFGLEQVLRHGAAVDRDKRLSWRWLAL